MTKYVTKSVVSDINKFVEQQTNVPFTMKNIYKMIELVVGTHQSRMERVLVEAFEKICSYSDDNSNYNRKEGWKTNSSYKVNLNFIIPRLVEESWSGKMSLNNTNSEELDDIIKALCYITGEKYENIPPMRLFFRYRYKLKTNGKYIADYGHYFDSLSEAETKVKSLKQKGIIAEIEDSGEIEFGKWYEWGFFKFKGFKKGTGHFKFIDEKVWKIFNREVARIKGWQLPNFTDTKKTGKEKSKKSGLVIIE